MSPIKESSDELNPDVAISGSDIAPRKHRTAMDYLALAIATCGVGYFPIAPGTLGSLLGIAIYLPFEYQLSRALGKYFSVAQVIETPWVALRLVLIMFVTMVGIWAASRTERLIGKKDPGIVVIDEVAGQLIALLSVPLFFPGWLPVLSAFLLFRAFDIWKPYPIRRLEGLESGLGIMADDVLAGVYALIVNSVLIFLYLLFVAVYR
jgi:phosphatidylglycerophosphatase A